MASIIARVMLVFLQETSANLVKDPFNRRRLATKSSVQGKIMSIVSGMIGNRGLLARQVAVADKRCDIEASQWKHRVADSLVQLKRQWN